MISKGKRYPSSGPLYSKAELNKLEKFRRDFKGLRIDAFATNSILYALS